MSLRSVHGKFLSAQPDGRAEWNRDVALDWELFNVEPRTGGKIALKGIHGMYVSAQPDGTVQINRRAAPPGGWEEFTVEERGNNVICLKSYHGKPLERTGWQASRPMEPRSCTTWRLGRHPNCTSGNSNPRAYTY
ncbi:MAG: hypothetical protein CM15mP2_1700 [Methanobacteriota archaeon]|nr:MAG: hypothetical protein CM15mP2_1700 [Euryarchaeota archaeon]